MKKILLIAMAGLLLAACGNNKTDREPIVSKEDSTTQIPAYDAGYMMLAVLYYQQAAETDALYHQGFNLAKMILEKELKVKGKKPAIVLDIDETVLDNSPYEAQCILGNFSYPDKWEEWCNKAIAEPTPGAVDFLKYASDKGVEIFYITNRKAKLGEATLRNLSEKGLPFADTTHVLLRTEGNSKEERRQQVLKDFRIVLYMGDNLADFAAAFDGKQSSDQRAAVVDSLKAEFGNRFIVFPNSMYGDWEMALYADPADPQAAKDSARRANLKGF